MGKNIVLKELVFTENLTGAFRGFWGPECQCCEGDKAVYVTNSYIFTKLDLGEYNKFVRPLTQRDAGSFTVNPDGTPRMTHDLREILENYASKPGEDLIAMPRRFDWGGGSLSTYYCPSGDFVVCLNTKFASAIAPGTALRAKNDHSGVVCYRRVASTSRHTLEPVAVIMPVRAPQDSKPVQETRKWFSARRKAGVPGGQKEIHPA